MSRLSFWFHIISFYGLALIWLAGTVIIGVFYLLWLFGIASFWLIGFLVSKSTKVPADPIEVPLTPIVRLSFREYDQWANHIVRLAMNENLLDSNYVHWTQKMSLLMTSLEASSHVWAPHLSKLLLTVLDVLLILGIFSPDVTDLISRSQDGQLIGFGIVSSVLMGHSSGWASGLFYRWLRAKW